jgi:hypothetical protein
MTEVLLTVLIYFAWRASRRPKVIILLGEEISSGDVERSYTMRHLQNRALDRN